VQANVAAPQQVSDLIAVLTTHLNASAFPEMSRVLGELDISFTQMKVLHALDAAEDEISLKSLAAYLSMSLPAMSRSVDGLVNLGLVARRESDADRRSRLLALLPRGRVALRRVSAAREAAVTAFVADLPDADRTALRDALLPIVERITSP
jgi:DNA-binding MarR family transcriptional regulator